MSTPQDTGGGRHRATADAPPAGNGRPACRWSS